MTTNPHDPHVLLDERLLVIALTEASQRMDVEAVEQLVAAHRDDCEFWRRAHSVACRYLAESTAPHKLAELRAAALAETIGAQAATGSRRTASRTTRYEWRVTSPTRRLFERRSRYFQLERPARKYAARMRMHHRDVRLDRRVVGNWHQCRVEVEE